MLALFSVISFCYTYYIIKIWYVDKKGIRRCVLAAWVFFKKNTSTIIETVTINQKRESDMGKFTNTVVAVASAVTAAGVLALAEMVRRGNLAREYGTYADLDDVYREFLNDLYRHPHLDPYYHSADNLTATDKNQQKILFEKLISLLERAYLVYTRRPDADQKQWKGWVRYMKDWLSIPAFREAWKELSPQYAPDFVYYVNTELLN